MKVIAPLIVAVILLSVGAYGILNHQKIRDTIEGWSYTPSSEMIKLESNVGLTDDGRRVFHATLPSIISAEAFNEKCPRQELASPIIGCYTPQDSIYIYDISNEKLNGIKDVTAVHELMHAVWTRMSASERDRVSALVKRDYEASSDDSLRKRMEYYDRTEKGQELNELHSILGTEWKKLSPELEAHYSKYFDRTAVVSLYSKYQAQYKSIEDEAGKLQAKLEALAASISAKNIVYEREAAALESDIRAFNARAQGGDFSSQAQFNSSRAQLLARSSRLEAERGHINQEVDQYNNTYEQYKQLAQEIQTLNDSLDSFKSLQKPPAAQI